MNQRLLVILGLIAIPFYELIFKVFPYVKVMAPDTRAPKELVAIWFALAIGLLAVFQGKIKPFSNKYLLVIPLYLLFNLWMAPQVDLFINNVNCGDLYFWKPFVQVLCFSLMIIAIASSDDDFTPVLKIMTWCGVVMAGYVVMQKLGFDQFWVIKEPPKGMVQWPDSQIGGNLGQCTIVASFIAMLIPLAVYLKKYWMVAVLAIGVICSGSDMAMLAMIVMMLSYGLRKFCFSKTLGVLLIILIIIASSLAYLRSDSVRNFSEKHSSGRITVWKDIISDIRDGNIEGVKQDFSTTGVGFGRFAFIFPDKHKSLFVQAHNDFLEFTYNCGFVGLLLLLAGLMFVFKNITPSDCNFAILLSFISILFMSLGSFPFQLGAHQFYAAILVGLLHKSGGIRCS